MLVGKPRQFGWANDYFFYQPEFEAQLRDGFAALENVRLETGAAFGCLRQDAAGVTVSYLQKGKALSAQARWVIAADGASSPVRKALGIALDDLDFEEPWLVVDAQVDGDVRFPDLAGVPADADLQRLSVMMCDPQRPATIVPGRGNHRRWEFMLLPGEDDAEMMRDDAVSRLLAPYLSGVDHRVTRAATYRFHGLVAEEWQAGNVFLAGDAAHQTPPFFGQGMCHGFRDVANLAWKMAAIARGKANEDILATYQPERDPHVRAVIGAAVEAGRYICMLDPQQAARRDAQMREHGDFGRSQTAGDLIPPIGAGLVLLGSPGAGERFIQPRLANGRLLDDHTGHGLRLFARDGAVSTSPSDITAIRASALYDDGAIIAWMDEQGVDAVLVRPDHYVFGTASGDAAPLLDAWRSALADPQGFERELA